MVVVTADGQKTEDQGHQASMQVQVIRRLNVLALIRHQVLLQAF